MTYCRALLVAPLLILSIAMQAEAGRGGGGRSKFPRCLDGMKDRIELADYVSYLGAHSNVLRAFDPCQYPTQILDALMAKLQEADSTGLQPSAPLPEGYLTRRPGATWVSATREEGYAIVAAKLANILYVEVRGLVPWLLADYDDTALERSGTSADLAYVIYTSGSTGKPKGAMNTHRGICNRLLWMQDEYRLTESDVVLQKTPFSFDVSVWEFFWPLMAGARMVLAKPGGHRDNRYLVDLIERENVSVLHFVPSMLRLFLEEPGLERCASLRDVICSGEALPLELQQRFFKRLDAGLHNLYGPTEAAIDVTYWRCRFNAINAGYCKALWC